MKKQLAIMSLVATLICWLLPGCTWTPEKRKAVSAALWQDAKGILEQDALNTLSNVVQQAANNGQVDFAHAAAGALFATVSADSVHKVVLDATGNNLPQLADVAAKAVTQAMSKGVNEKDAIQAVASAISATALTKN